MSDLYNQNWVAKSDFIRYINKLWVIVITWIKNY